MTPDPRIVYAARYGFNLKPIIDEICLREQIPANADNQRKLANAKRRLKRNLKKCGYAP